MKKGSITKFKLNPKKPPKTDWRAFDAMTEEQRHRAAVSDPDAPPATEAQLARARRVPTVRALRKKLNLTQEEFAARFHLPLGTVRDWEQGAHRPDKQDFSSRAGSLWLPTKNIENNPMQSSTAVAGKDALGQYLTRRANQRHSFIIAQSARRPRASSNV